MNLVKLLLEINKISRELSFSLNNHELGFLLYEKINKLIKINSFGLGQVDFDKNEVIFNFLIENGKVLEELSLPIKKESSYAYYCVKNKETIIINNVEEEEGNYIQGRSILGLAKDQPKSMMFLPIYWENKVIGFLTIQDNSYNFFNQENVILFKEISKYLGVILVNLEKQKLWEKKLDKHQNKNQKIMEANEILTYVNNFATEIMKCNTFEDIAKKVVKSFYELYDIDSIKFIIYKDWKNKKLIFTSDLSNLTVEETLLDEIEEVENNTQKVLKYNDETVGFIQANHKKIFSMDSVNVTFINLLSLALSNILEKMRLKEAVDEKIVLTDALKQSYNNLKAINTIGEKITSTLDFNKIGQRVYESMKEIFEGDCTVGMGAYDRDNSTINFEFMIDYGETLDYFEVSSDSKSSFAAHVIRTGKMLVINNEEIEGEKYISDGKSMVGVISTQSLIFMPLFIRDNVIGVFTFQKKEKNFIDKYTIEVINNISSFLAVALDNAIEAKQLSVEIEERKRVEKKLKETNEILKKFSREDSLTELYNRREFERLLFLKWDESKQEGLELSLIIIDVDYFKQVNDNLGHLEGDNYLIKISNVLKSFENKDVFFGRYGGDEFIGLFYGDMAVKVEEIAEEIRKGVKGLNLPNPVVEDSLVTLTIGIASVRPSTDYNVNDFFRMADNAMYKGKKSGRDRIIKF